MLGKLFDGADKIITFRDKDYVVTNTGNKVSRKACLYGIPSLILKSMVVIKDGAILRGDLDKISIGIAPLPLAPTGAAYPTHPGKCTVLSEDTVVRPYLQKSKSNVQHHSVSIGSSVFLGPAVVSEARSIGDCVYVGANAILGKRSRISECCYVMPNSVLADSSVMPPYSCISGNPAQVVSMLPESFGAQMQVMCASLYANFVSTSALEAHLASDAIQQLCKEYAIDKTGSTQDNL
eukprot:gene10347-1873_t